jgi:hypothetical protein
MENLLYTVGDLEVRALTKADAEELGHIAWIEGDNLPKLIARWSMLLQQVLFNCAVWANVLCSIPMPFTQHNPSVA